MAVASEWVGAERDHAQNAIRNVRVFEYFQPSFHLIKRTPTLVVNSEDIIKLLGTVHASADPDVMFTEHLGPRLIDQCSIGLDYEIHRCDILQHLAGLATPGIELPHPD
jgi:hypothetical protein